MKPRVLQLVGSFHQGGSERQAIALARMLKNEGSFDVLIATLNGEGVLRDEAEAIGLGLIGTFPLTSFYNASFVRQVRFFARYLREQKIDLIHTHDFYTNVFGMVGATLAGVPVRIASKRETGEMRSRAQEFVERRAFARADAIVANSGAVKDHLIARGVDTGKITVVYNGVDLSRSTQTDGDIIEKLGLPGGKNVQLVTMVANLRHSVKNIPMLLRAAKRVVGERPDTHLAIAGEGELENELKQIAREMNVAANVHFLGRCDNISSLLSASSVCVLTSSAEGFSNSILEYMAAAKPVVATNVGGAAEALLDGETGYLVASDDDAALATHLLTLLDDKKRAQKMGLAGRKVAAQQFSSARQLSSIIDLYQGHLSEQKIYSNAAELCKI